MIALDANIFIYFLEGNSEFGNDSVTMFRYGEHDKVELCASDITIMEVLAQPLINAVQAEAAYAKLMALGVRYEPISRRVLLEAARLRRAYQFGAMDAIHVASAILAGCTHFITNDRHILRKKLPEIHITSLKSATKLFV